MGDSEIFEKDGVEIEIVKEKKKKRKLTEKQLENLRLGREKMKAKREALKKEKEKELKRLAKEDKKAVKENKVIKKENKKSRRVNTELSKKAEEHRKKLLENKRIKLLEKENEMLRKSQANKLSKFEDLRSRWLLKADNLEDYDTISEELDSIPEEIILDDQKLESSLLDIVKKYKGENYDREQ